MKKVITGNHATAYGAKLARPGVIAAYPITPQTTIVEYIADFIADGELDCQFIKVESEHSAMAACISAANTGVRTFTATSAHGLALMHEMLMWASAARLPVVMVNVNRAMGPPWSIWADHLDSIAQRDTGWMQIYCENNQEILDTTIMSFKVSESRDILMPTMLTEDAFYLSHTVEPVDIPDQELVDEFLPPYDPPYKLDVDRPYGFGSLVMPNNYMEFRYLMKEALDRARERIVEVDREFERTFGRYHGGLLDLYRTEDADHIIVAAGTISSTVREVVDELRAGGESVGLARIRVFRPFPLEEVRRMAEGRKGIAVLDRVYSFGAFGPFYTELVAALYGIEDRPVVKDYLIGIGGRDVRPRDIRDVYSNLKQVVRDGLDEETTWHGLKRPGGES
ncbi:MAG TPA: pyruvate ferredoxin oxidoreductase [Thermoplasmata archaeon]|nr:pyruvate ferredoxin oxidoreductase [Thermoplasmata archaeon]